MKAMLAASSPNAAATTQQQRRDAFLCPDQLRHVTVRRFDGGKEGRATDVAGRDRAEVEHQRLAMCVFGCPYGAAPQRADRGRLEPA